MAGGRRLRGLRRRSIHVARPRGTTSPLRELRTRRPRHANACPSSRVRRARLDRPVRLLASGTQELQGAGQSNTLVSAIVFPSGSLVRQPCSGWHRRRPVRRLEANRLQPRRRAKGKGQMVSPGHAGTGAITDGRGNRARASARAVASEGATRNRRVETSASPRRQTERFQNASTSHFGRRSHCGRSLSIPLRKRLCGYGRCLARTGDLLLVRGERCASVCCRLPLDRS